MLGQLRVSISLRILVLAAVLGLLAGCTTLRSGGAPKPSFNIKSDIKDLEAHFQRAASITGYYQAPSEAARNQFIVGRLALTNLRYLQWIRNLTRDRQLLDSATSISLLGLTLAGATVPLAETKTILSTIAAGITGSQDVINETYYFKKSIPALVAQMNAERQKKLIPILDGSKRTLQEYSFEQAVTDLHNYYLAGTFMGAIQAIQEQAALEGKKASRTIASITRPTKEQIKEVGTITEAVGKMTAADKEKMKIIVRAYSPEVIPSDDFQTLLVQVQDIVFDAPTIPGRTEELTRTFKELGFLFK